MFYIIYKITNKINKKIYIGKHKTNNIKDNYFGSGIALKSAIKKYGIFNFTKEILFIFDNEIDMNNKEKEIVNEKFVKSKNNYNLRNGGNGEGPLTKNHKKRLEISHEGNHMKKDMEKKEQKK